MGDIEAALTDYRGFVEQLLEKARALQATKKSYEEESQGYTSFIVEARRLEKNAESAKIRSAKIAEVTGEAEAADVSEWVSLEEDIFVEARMSADAVAAPYVHVGLGFHVSLPVDDAIEVAEARQEILARRVAALDEETALVVSDVQEAAEAVAALEQLAGMK